MEWLSALELERIAVLVAEGAPFWRLRQEVPRSRYAIYRAVKRLRTLAANLRVARAVRAGIFRGADRVAGARSEFARDLTKRVLRLTPFVALDVLSDQQLSDLIDDRIGQSAAALR